MIDLPEAFIQRMRRQLGNELPDFLRAMEEPPVRGIRMNPFKSFEGMNGYTSGDPVPWTENGYYLPATSTAGSTVFHEAGLLVSNEPVMKRAQILSRNMERIGIPNSVITCMYPAEIPHSWDEMFDGVLVDAPCSGEGMFRRDPQTRSEWSREMSAGCAKRQREILEEASRLLRPGGRMVYSTCTYNPEENEETAREFLDTHTDFSEEAFHLNGANGENGDMLCTPHRIKGEGQFTFLMRKKGEREGLPETKIPFSAAGREEKELLKKSIPGLPEPRDYRNPMPGLVTN